MTAGKKWIYDPLRNSYHNCPTHHQFEVIVSWRLEVSGIELKYDDTENAMIIEVYNLPCYFDDGFCKPTTKTLFTLIWFSYDFCLIFTLQDFIGRMTKFEDRYWIETDAPHTQNPHNPNLSRFEDFPNAQTFCGKPHPLYSKQYSDVFVNYTDGFNMHTGQPNSQSIINEKMAGKFVLDDSKIFISFTNCFKQLCYH